MGFVARAIIAVTPTLCAGVPAARAGVIYANDFETAVGPGWSSTAPRAAGAF
jgi:hypothetical protein